MTRSHFSHASSFARALFAYDLRGTLLNLGLMLGLGALRGGGVLLLIPLLSYIGVSGAAADEGPVGAVAHFFFDGLGLPRSLPLLLGLFVVVEGAMAALARAQALLNMRLHLGFVRRLRHDLFEALLHAEWRFMTAERHTDLAQVLTHETQRAGQAAFFAMAGCVAFATLAVYTTIALRIAPVLTLLTMGTVGVLSLLLRSKLTSAQQTGQALTPAENTLYAVIGEHLGGLKEIRSNGAEARSLDRFDAATRTGDDVRLRFQRAQTAATLWMKLGASIVLCLLLLIAIEYLRVPVASLLVLVYLFARMLPLVMQLNKHVLTFANLLPAFDAVHTLTRRARDRADVAGSQAEAQAAPPLNGDIVFEGVSFGYHPDRPLLNALDLHLPEHQTTALVGPSGVGKSTVALLLMGLLHPQKGRLMVGGVPLRPVHMHAWRAGIGYVPQETFLIHESVRANLLWAVPEASEAALWDALERAAAAAFVRRLPHGLDTVVGDRGVRLSGGERQRLALARALLRKPALLVLDEATSALDTRNERHIYDALAALHGQLTVLVITHRRASLRHADQVVELAPDGRARRVTEDVLLGTPTASGPTR